MVNPLWQWDHIPQGMGISFHTYLPTVFTSSVVLVSFQAITQRPKTGNILIGPRQISWETHTIFTFTTYPSSCCFTDKCHAVDLTCGISVAELSYKDRRMDRHRHGHTLHPFTHTPDLYSPASISETFQGVEQELALSLRNSTKISVCWVTLRHGE